MRRVFGLVGLALLGSGCLVDISHPDDPRRDFAKARGDAAQIQGRPGPPHQLNVLVYDADERELVKVSTPLWLVRKVSGLALKDEDRHDDGAELVRRCLDEKNLAKAGLGVLVEVDEEGGDQVLVWLK